MHYKPYNKIFLIIIFSVFLIQLFFNLNIDKEFIVALLTIFSIFFSFYFTSFIFFASSKYSATLYKTVDEDNPGMTLLHTLMSLFKSRIRFLFYIIFYLVFLYVMSINKENVIFKYLEANINLYGVMIFISPFTFLWSAIIFNIFYIISSISLFIKIIIKSIEEPE